MLINRRELLKKTAMGTAGLALTPSFDHLMAAPAEARPDSPHRFVFIRKSNGNLPQQFGLPSFSSKDLKRHNEKQAFELDLSNHELPEWLNGLADHKENMRILHGISMTVSGGDYSK